MYGLDIGAVNSYLRMLRVESWIGWLFNFALGSVLFAIPAFNRFVSFSFSFILATAGIFVLNQYFDRENDKLNEFKRDLPVSSGEISPKTALNIFYLTIFLSICLVLLPILLFCRCSSATSDWGYAIPLLLSVLRTDQLWISSLLALVQESSRSSLGYKSPTSSVLISRRLG